MIVKRKLIDFKNKSIIELYGDYWHNRPESLKRDKNRIKIFKSYGYRTLIIWEHELQNEPSLKSKILKFNKKVA